LLLFRTRIEQGFGAHGRRAPTMALLVLCGNVIAELMPA
jgi:hypothetical protein